MFPPNCVNVAALITTCEEEYAGKPAVAMEELLHPCNVTFAGAVTTGAIASPPLMVTVKVF